VIGVRAGAGALKMPGSVKRFAHRTARKTLVSAALTMSCFASNPFAKVPAGFLLSGAPDVGMFAKLRKKKPVVVVLRAR
jgi:hypothetical protein